MNKLKPTAFSHCSLGIVIFLFLGSLNYSMGTSYADEVTWYDGSKAPKPQGTLLTNNAGYWGASTATNVSYSYPEAPTNPPDTLPGEEKSFGNRLLDGQRGGDWNSPVGIDGQPLVVDFDFHQLVTLSYVAVNEYQRQDLRLAELEVRSGTNEEWRKVFSSQNSKGPLHRLPLEQATKARYVRLRVQSTGAITFISQVWMWGQATPVARNQGPDGFYSDITTFPATQNAAPGNGTVLSEAALASWRKTTGVTGSAITWQSAPSWQMMKKDPLRGNFLPGKDSLRQPIQLKTTRDEKSSGAMFLVNASDKAQEVTAHLSPFKDARGNVTDNIEAELFVAGSIWTRRWGQTLRPLFSSTNKLGGDLMEKYLTNGSVIKDFPRLHLPARGTALLWVGARTKDAAPGMYRATIGVGTQAIPVEVQVLPLTLPSPDVWLRFWGNAPASTSNLWSDEQSIESEIAYQREMGASVRESWPTPNSPAEVARKLGEKNKQPTYFVVSIPADIQGMGYNGQLTPAHFEDEAFRKRITDMTQEYVARARQLGLDYNDWSIELWDEPGIGNMPTWAAIARLIRAADPKVQIYMNPLFWTKEGTNPEGFINDQRQVQSLQGWYNELVDISVPIQGQTDTTLYPEANRLFYNHQPRHVRAFYIHPNPGRSIAWEAFLRDYNGWGSYAYFVPRKDPWNDFDHPEFDYQIVYPGPTGYIPTIESESMCQSWNDYRVLTLLKQKGKSKELAQILNAYKASVVTIPTEETTTDRDLRSMNIDKALPHLHAMALQAAMKLPR